ncbi:MAG: hypothetical protein WCX71_02310 [Candidatus Buchananbacteria bacterium]
MHITKNSHQTKSRQKNALKLRVGVLALFVLLLPQQIFARTFNPHNIITDEELTDQDSLSQAAIQNFLKQEKSILASYHQKVDGQSLSAAEIIWTISQKHNISPKFLLTTLEKEQGLIRRTSAPQKAFDWACGYGCFNNTCKEKFRGFYNQVEAAAETQEIYRQKAGQFSFQINKTTMTNDGFAVTPQNQATANFYIYTPYVGYSPELGVMAQNGGNRLFWTIWQRYFTEQKFLDGQIVTDNANYWLITNNTKRKFLSQELFLSDYKLTDAIFTSAKNLAAYPDGLPIKFAQNTLVKSAISGQIYLIDGNQKRPIIEESALALLSDFHLALTGNEITSVSEEDLQDYSIGSMIASTSVMPQGKLYQDTSGAIWLVKDGMKYLVDPLVWQTNFNAKPMETIEAAALEQYQKGSPVKFKDGTFLNVDGSYYLISDGERMKINNLGVFDRVFGLEKKNGAIKVSAALLNVHAAGDIIDYVDDTIVDALSNASSNDSTNPASNLNSGSYEANFVSQEPQGLVSKTGQSQNVTITFKNIGSATWQKGQVWLAHNDQGKNTSSFTMPTQVQLNQDTVAPGQDGTFTFSLTAPTDKNGLIAEDFSLYYNTQTPTKIFTVTKFILVEGEITKTNASANTSITSQITSQNLPAKIKNTAKPVAVKIKIKNTSKNTVWLSKKTALEIYTATGAASPFYDKNDWVRKNVAAVPANKSSIKPGETAEFKFTLAAKGLKAGNYTLKFQLNLLDKNQSVLINDKSDWQHTIKVY